MHEWNPNSMLQMYKDGIDYSIEVIGLKRSSSRKKVMKKTLIKLPT